MKWYQSKTIWGGFTAIIAGVGMYFQTGDINALGTSLAGMMMVALRFVTKQPID